MKLNPGKTALAVGLFLAAWHLCWSVLVALNWAQPFYDFVLWAHMIHLALVIGPFDLMASATLIVVTGVMGAVFGYVFALIWNALHRA